MRHEASVKEVITVSPDVKLVRLTWEGAEEFPFRPGQWVGLWCDEFKQHGSSRPLRRAFSIASSPGDPYLEFCIARGKALSAHLQDLAPGAKVWVDGPFGMFWLRPAKKYLFVAGGTGIAPVMPMIKQALEDGAEVTLLYSFKTATDFLYKAELQNMRKLTLVPSITREAPKDWPHRRGRITTFLDEFYDPDAQVYICGPPGMVEATEEKLVELGQPKELIFVDKWE